jgi:hypothetical protein
MLEHGAELALIVDWIDAGVERRDVGRLTPKLRRNPDCRR